MNDIAEEEKPRRYGQVKLNFNMDQMRLIQRLAADRRMTIVAVVRWAVDHAFDIENSIENVAQLKQRVIDLQTRLLSSQDQVIELLLETRRRNSE